MQRKAERAR
jgi:hypothetical protein